jgi:hypothetical protein
LAADLPQLKFAKPKRGFALQLSLRGLVADLPQRICRHMDLSTDRLGE